MNALCAVLDSFHFDLAGEEEATDLKEPEVTPVVVIDSYQGDVDAADGDEESGDVLEEGEGGGADDVDAITDEVDDVVKELDGAEEEDEEAVEEVVTVPTPYDASSSSSPQAISRVVVNSMLPWLRVFLLKDERDHKGNKTKTVRPQMAIALTKLICRLKPPVVSEQKRMGYFINLVISVSGTLRSRDASARDLARQSLSEMVVTMGLDSLKPVIFELRHMLKEGYQRHICNYSIRAILNHVLIDYSLPSNESVQSLPILSILDAVDPEDVKEQLASSFSVEEIEEQKPPLDQCLPLIIRSVLDDLIGESRDDFDATEEGKGRVVIRESKGSKANDILEICAKYLLFRPTYALLAPERSTTLSSIHAITTPLLDALQNSEDSKLIGRISEALQRTALGLSRNSSIVASELLFYLHSTLQPFVMQIIKDNLRRKQSIGMIVKPTDSTTAALDIEALNEDDLFGEDFPSYLHESSDEETSALYSKKKKSARHDNVTGYRANVWMPSTKDHKTTQREVIEERNREALERSRVQDGASAPKLTGRLRHQGRDRGPGSSSGKFSGGATDPAALAAVKFCLTLLQSCIKNERLSVADEHILVMLQPFIPLLAHCLRLNDAGNIATLALRSLCTLLNWGVAFSAELSGIIGNQVHLIFTKPYIAYMKVYTPIR